MERIAREQDRIIGVLSMEFTVADGNEAYQNFLKDRRAYPLPQMIHEEDRARFYSCVETSAEQGFETLVRVLGQDKQYHWQYLFMKKVQTEGWQSVYHMEMRDVYAMEERLEKLEILNEQYERFMSMQNSMYFLYSYETKMLRIFLFRADQLHMLVEEELDKWEEEQYRLENVTKEEEAVLHMLCRDIREGNERFTHDISMKTFSYQKEEKHYRFTGSAWQKKARLTECYGMIQLLDKKTKRIKQDIVLEEQLDPLTGLYNKRACMQKLRSLLEDGADAAVTICMIDIDNFKTLNDTYGHLFGDRVLTVVADTMRDVLGNRGIIGRFGGDEFFIVIDGAIDEQEVRQILFTIRKNIRWYFESSEEQLVVTLSVGTANCPKDATTMDELFAKADRALYIAKEKGKDRYIIYDEEKHGRVTFDAEHRKIVEMSRQKREEKDMTFVVMQVYDMLQSKGIDGIDEVMKFVGKTFLIDRIMIYRNPDMQFWKGWGYEVWHQGNAGYVLQEGYLNNFNANKVDICSDLQLRSWKYPKTTEHLSKLGIKSNLQYIIGEESDMAGLISFELCKIKRKWSDEDAHNLSLISHFIGNTILKAVKDGKMI